MNYLISKVRKGSLDLKIFQSKDTSIALETSVINLLDNDLALNDKIQLLINSIDEIKQRVNGEQIIIERIFNKLSEEIYFPRKGDNSERFDALINFKNYRSVVEIEIPSTAILDAPRNLLDDYAVLNCRRTVTNEIIPLVICWDLPNKRTDYWNVISDIYSILELKIKTITIPCLALYYWTNSSIDFSNDDFFLYHDRLSITVAEKILEKYNLSTECFPGFFSPLK